MTEATRKPETARLFDALGADLAAGMPVLRSLRKIEEELSGSSIAEIINMMATDIGNGATLSEAIEKHPDTFDEAAVLLVRSGEASGMLDRIMPILAEYMLIC